MHGYVPPSKVRELLELQTKAKAGENFVYNLLKTNYPNELLHAMQWSTYHEIKKLLETKINANKKQKAT